MTSSRRLPPRKTRLFALAILLLPSATLCACGEEDAETDRLLQQGKDHYWKGQHTEAIEVLKSFLKRRPENTDGHLYLTKSYMQLGENNRAEGQIEAAISVAPDDGRFSELRGIIHTARFASRPYTEGWQGEGEAAIAAFQIAISLDPLRPGPYYNLGIMYDYLDSTKLAAEAFLSALRADSTVAPAHKKLGLIYRNQGDC